MRNKFTSQTFDAEQLSAVLVQGAPLAPISLCGVVFAAHADNSVSPAMRVKLGGATVVEHPGVPAGGGLVATELGITGAQGDSITFECDEPTGGSVSVLVIYGMG